MKINFIYILLLYSNVILAQYDQLAQYYFDKGEFEKSKNTYEELLQKSPSNTLYFAKIVECYQQLQQFELAEKALQDQFSKYKFGFYLVEIGYNYQLQKDQDKAKIYYDKALEKVKVNPSEVYAIANAFEKKVLLNYALTSYELAMSREPRYNFKYQTGLLYGQLGDTDKMITLFLDEAYENPQNSNLIQIQLARFMNGETDSSTFKDALRKQLLLKTQQDQNVYWNQYLSWFFVQQKEFDKAFVQEKAIFKRNPESLSGLINLSQYTVNEGDSEVAAAILNFILEKTTDFQLKVKCEYELMQIKIANAKQADYLKIVAELEQLLITYEVSPITLSLQIAQAHFLAFKVNKIEQAKAVLNKALLLNLSDYERADVKMELADIFLMEEKFNQALLYYSQIQVDLKNDVLGQEASLKAAKTSYFKGDFEWAVKQFKELKAANTQLIANDALEYYLLINDNIAGDSTHVALNAFAKGDLLHYQNKNNDAIAQFKKVLAEFKDHEIESVTLFRLGKIYEESANFTEALVYYERLVEQYADGIYADEGLFFGAQLYARIGEVEKAKKWYEKLIFSHQDSVYFVDARNEYRKLRGETNI